MFSRFEIIPAIDLQDGTVVQLVGGDPDTGTQYGDPVSIANRWTSAGASTLHIVDLDGAIAGERRNDAIIDEIIDAVAADLQLGGGIRSADEARALLDRGIDRVILGTAAIETPSLVTQLNDTHPQSVVVSLDASEGEVVVEGWTEGTGIDPARAAQRYESLGAAGILFTDVDIEGRQTGIRAEVIENVVEAVDIPVIASGGVASLADLRRLREVGAAAVVVGTALYEGTFSYQEALKAIER